VYSELFWAIGIVAILQVVLTFSRWGLYTVAIGSNKLGAAEAGVKVKLVTVRNFVLCALTAGLVGIFEAVRSATIQPDPSGPNELLLYAIAGAVIGGTLLSGGSGTVVGAFIGALFLGVLKDGLILQGVNANYLLFYSGLAIVIAMTANVFVARARRGHTGLG
jgi:simple sugar transport system permease protein